MTWLGMIGVLLLLAVGLLAFALRRTATGAARVLPPVRLRSCKRAIRLVRSVLREQAEGRDLDALREAAIPLLAHLTRFEQIRRRLSPLPADADGEPRLMPLAREAADREHIRVSDLVEILSGWNGATLTSREIAAFPVCIAAAETQRFTRVLRALRQDLRQRQAGLRLANQLMRCRQPEAAITKTRLGIMGQAALLAELRQHQQGQLVSLAEAWMTQRGQSAEEIVGAGMARQLRLAEEIRRALSCFSALERLNWPSCCAEADALHALLMKEPSGVYARMTPASQLALREKIDDFSRHVRLDTAEVIRQAFILCDEAEEHSLERYVGTFFQDAEGMAALHRALPARRGWLYAHLSLRQEQMTRAGLWIFGILAGFLFLQGRQPVFMLPFFAVVAGSVLRSVAARRTLPPLPAMTVDAASPELKTLVLLYAPMADTHAAIQAVRRLKTVRSAMKATQADFLLVGDFAPGMTAVSGEDHAIIHAALSAIAALDAGGQVAYLQRGRSWDSTAHLYCAQAGMQGAVTAVCRLIAQGECESVIAYSTVEAASLERRYAYVLALPVTCRIAPGMMEQLLAAMVHPLCQRYPSQKGYRGVSMLLPEEAQDFGSAALIRPDAFLEATDGLVPVHRMDAALCGELAGQVRVPGAHVQAEPEDTSWSGQYEQVIRAGRLLPWQLPWVNTPSGVVSNPLGGQARFSLREMLRRKLVPLAQCVLLAYSVLTRNWLLLLLALLAPELRPMRRREDWWTLLCHLSLLPMRGAVGAAGLIQLIRRKPEQLPEWTTLEVWVQGMSATLMGALAFLLPGFAVPAFGLTLLFGCFPLAHRFLETPVMPTEPLTDTHITLMDSAAKATWRYFVRHTTEETRHLPPCTVQFEPALGEDQATSPRAAGAYLLGCMCAKELHLLSADEAAARIGDALSSVAEWPMPWGLPCQRYALPSLTVIDARADAAATGFLLCALLTVGQALRTWLPELRAEFANLSAEAARLADAFDLAQLYDREANLCRAGLDQDGQGTGYITDFDEEVLLLSVAGCALGKLPPEHLLRLQRVGVALREGVVACSAHGGAGAHLLAGLFLPTDERENLNFIRAMASCGQAGLFGQDDCREDSFDPSLRYRRGRFGVAQIATTSCDTGAVFAPHASALCLPWMPQPAAEALLRYREIGALGPEGFCDAVSLRQGSALIGLHDSYHQGLTLMALAHLLADSPVRRYFCALPEVEACLPLLNMVQAPLVLPRLPVRTRPVPVAASPGYAAAPLTIPPEAHLMGTEEFRLVTDAHCCSHLYQADLPLTRPPEMPGGLFGMQFYVADEGRVYRLGHALLPGSISFLPGETRFEQLCGSLRAELVCTVDTVRRRALHVLTVTNLSTRDRLIDVADLLLPDLGQPPQFMEASRPEEGRLALHVRGTETTLRHSVEANPAPMALHVCTDAEAFLGRGRRLHQPAAMEEPAADLLATGAPGCLSFRAKLALGGRGQVMLWFTTGLTDAPAPQLAEMQGIRRLAALQHEAILDAAGLTAEQALCAQRLVGPVCAAQRRITVTQDAPECGVLKDVQAIAGWFRLHGMPLEIRPQGEEPSQGLVLQGDVPLTQQLDGMLQQIAPPVPVKPPVPALLPEKQLRHAGLYGGFDPETDDCIIQLQPRQSLPAPWENRHISRYFEETVDERGFLAPFHEQVWLEMPDGTRLSPWSADLPRSVRMGPGQTSWEAWSDALDLRLSAAPLPGHRCGLRVLSLRNAAGHALTLRITVQARLGDAPLSCAPGMVIADGVQRMQGYIAGEDWEARRTSAFMQEGVCGEAALRLPDDAQGRTAQLSCEVNLAGHAASTVCYLAGYARHSEDVVRALDALRSSGASAALRTNRAGWAQLLDTLSLISPEATLNLLMNRILPMQALSAGGLCAVPVMLFLSPREAKRALLGAARHAEGREAWATLALCASAYEQCTGDGGLWDAFLPQQDATLMACCHRALATLPLDGHELPLGEARARRCFLYALAAQALDAARPDPGMQSLHRKLLNAADIYLWRDGCYDEPLRLDVQSLACLAYGANPRTRQAMRSCWAVLYDQLHGLIRHQMPTDARPLPGLPENGGMVTADAVLCLLSLLKAGQDDEAFELLRALNPLHHTDTPDRQSVFRGAPYLLHGGMLASPLTAGQAVAAGGAEAAGWLFAAVLREVLGFSRQGDTVRLKPHAPADWEEFTLTLREGASTWRLSAERSISHIVVDGEACPDDHVVIQDDGRIHRVHFPLG